MAIRCARVRASRRLVSNPSSSTRPESGAMAPATSRSSVDLPLAFGPRMATSFALARLKRRGFQREERRRLPARP